MIPGVTGTLLSLDALTRTIPEALRGRLDEAGRELVRKRMRSWHEPIRRHLGPAVTARGVYDRLAGPLMARFGYRVIPTWSDDQTFRAVLDVDGRRAGVLLVTSWGEESDGSMARGRPPRHRVRSPMVRLRLGAVPSCHGHATDLLTTFRRVRPPRRVRRCPHLCRHVGPASSGGDGRAESAVTRRRGHVV